MAKSIRLKSLEPLPKRSEDQNDRLVKAHQRQLVRIQQALLFTGERAVVVFQGMDAAGKGGTIRRLAWAMDPRSLKVWPIDAPNDIERKQHYLQRFWTRLPEKTQIAVFDRSWYGRVLVERVEGFASREQWLRAYEEINGFERSLTDEGTILSKFWLHISPEEQLKRFKAREKDPLKTWKLTPDDWRNREKADEYRQAVEDMVARTSQELAPWHLVPAESKRYARVAVIETVIADIEAGMRRHGMEPPEPIED